MYRSLETQTVTRLGREHFDRYDRAYEHFVGLYKAGVLSGVLLHAYKEERHLGNLYLFACNVTAPSAKSTKLLDLFLTVNPLVLGSSQSRVVISQNQLLIEP